MMVWADLEHFISLAHLKMQFETGRGVRSWTIMPTTSQKGALFSLSHRIAHAVVILCSGARVGFL